MPLGWRLRPGPAGETDGCTNLVIGTVTVGDRPFELCHYHTREAVHALYEMGFDVQSEAGTAEASALVRPLSKAKAEALVRSQERRAARR